MLKHTDTEEKRRTFILDSLQKIMEIIFFSTNVHYYNIAFRVSVGHVQVCFKSILKIMFKSI